MIRHLYIHIPFCPKICPYCSFYKETSDRNKTQGFLDAVLQELEMRQETLTLQPHTIFFGGGTPSALSTPQLDYLLTGLRQRLDLSALREWTLEMNPATVSLEKARLLLSLGVNRISMGVQSWEPRLLEMLGRVHSAEQARRSYEILRESGVANVNLDLIFGMPGQTLEEWDRTMETTIALSPDHISAYCLTYEEDTDFFLRLQRGEMVPNEEEEARKFERAMEVLEGNGYTQYEISNYARSGRECLHNLAYWTGKDYLGLGPSAFSTVGNKRWNNIADTARYTSAVKERQWPVHDTEAVCPETRRAEQVAFALRTDRGVRRSWLLNKEEEMTEFQSLGLLEIHPTHIVLTRKGKMLADTVAESLMA